jgi:hypothetical protein
MSQSFTFIDVVGNQAHYTVSEKGQSDDFHWSTDHGDHGVAPSSKEAEYRARTGIKRQHGGRPAIRRSRKDGQVFVALAITMNCNSSSADPLVQANTTVNTPMEKPELASVFHLKRHDLSRMIQHEVRITG